jgi:hypothetical protein
MGAGDACRPDAERLPSGAGPPLGSARGPLRAASASQARAVDPARGHAAGAVGEAARAASACPLGGTCALLAPARGLPIRPVLKHGPRSLTCVRADGRENPEGVRKLMGGIPLAGCTADRPRSSVKGSSGSMPVGTRKMVNYA